MLKIRLPLKPFKKGDHVSYPLYHTTSHWYPYVYVHTKGLWQNSVRFVQPSTGEEICVVPGVLCSK